MEKKDILYMVYCSQTGTDVFDLLYESGLKYSALKPLLNEWVIQKKLRTEDGKHYVFIGDGRMFSGKYKKEMLKRYAKVTKELIQKFINKERFSEIDAEEVNEDEEERLQERREYLEARRQELIKRMQAALNEHDEMENNEGKESFSEDSPNFDEYLNFIRKIMGDRSDNVNEDEDNDSKSDNDLCKLVLKNIIESIAVNKRDNHYFIEINGIALCETDAIFEFLPCNGKVYLCDQGATFCSLEETVELNDEVREKAKQIAVENGAEFIDKKICVEVCSAEQTLACLFRLYAAIERVYHIGDALPRKEKKAEVPKEYIEALEYVVRSRKASIIDLHAEFGFALNKIGLMFEWMEKEGFITSFNDVTKECEALLTLEEFKRRFGKK